MKRRAVGMLLAIQAAGSALAGRAAAAEYVVPPVMPVPTAWQGRAAAVVRILDKIDAHVNTLTLTAGETGSYKGLAVTVRSCMDRPDGLPTDAAAYLDIQDRHGDVPPFSGWTFSREPAIGVFESPIYGVQLQSCDGAAVAPMAPPLPLPAPPPDSAAPDDAAATGAANAPNAAGSSVSVDAQPGALPGAPPGSEPGDDAPRPEVTAPARPAPPGPMPRAGTPPGDAGPDGDAGQPNPVYPDGPPSAPPAASAPPQ